MDIRWKQRLHNYDRACSLLAEALAEGATALSMLEKEGVIQRFEYSFELAWKTLKDFLEEGGVEITPLTPRQVIKEAAAARLLPDAKAWIDMLDHRNLLSHNYDEEVFSTAVDAIEASYLPALLALREDLRKEASA